jgi:CubicO group peptidase (beta-lactamase class C family)
MSAAEDIPRELDRLFNAVVSEPGTHFNGNVLVADKGNILYKKSMGYADIGRKILNGDSTEFDLASLSKVFTAVAVMQLKEKGQLNLDDPLARFLPDFPYPDITLRQLLSHTSGLPDFEIFQSYGERGSGRRLTNDDLIPALRKWGKVVAPPGARWSYSSVGTGLLALMVEKISGLSFPYYVSEHICKPAGLRHTYVNATNPPTPDALRAVPYADPGPFSPVLTAADAVRRDSTNPFQAIVGPGLVVSSAEDLLLFDQALYGDTLLRASSREEMYTPVRLSDGSLAQLQGAPLYSGLGWAIDMESSAGEIVSHNGGSPGIATILLRNLRTHQTVIVLENTDNRAILSFGLNAMNLLEHRPLVRFGPMRGPPGPPPGSQPEHGPVQ